MCIFVHVCVRGGGRGMQLVADCFVLATYLKGWGGCVCGVGSGSKSHCQYSKYILVTMETKPH